MTVAEARAPLDANDMSTALRAWLAVWRRTRAPEVAGVIDRLSSMVVKGVPAIEGRTQKDAHEAWLRVAADKDPAKLGALLPELFAADRPKTRARLAAMAELDPDPRVARVLVDRIVTSWLSDYDNPVGTAVFKLLAHHGDRSCIALLQERWTKWDSEKGDRLPRLEKSVGKLPHAPLDLEEKSALEAALAVIDAREEGTSLNTPGDARLVAADKLLEAGDPRGELFALHQLSKKRSLTRAEAAREAALVKAHAAGWMGKLASVGDASTARFEDGVLVEFTVIAADIAGVLEAPEWQTVRSVDLQAVGNPAPLLRRWPNIVDVTVREPDALRAIAGSELPSLEALRYQNQLSKTYLGPFDSETLDLLASPRLTGLRRVGVYGLGLPPERFAEVIERLGDRLRTLDVHSMILDTFTNWIGVLDGAPKTLESVRVRGGWTLELTRGETGSFRRLRMALDSDPYGRPPGNYVTNLARDCRTWPAGSFESVEIANTAMLNKKHRQTMEAAAAHLVA